MLKQSCIDDSLIVMVRLDSCHQQLDHRPMMMSWNQIASWLKCSMWLFFPGYADFLCSVERSQYEFVQLNI